MKRTDQVDIKDVLGIVPANDGCEFVAQDIIHIIDQEIVFCDNDIDLSPENCTNCNESPIMVKTREDKMNRKRHTEEQIIRILKEQESGIKVRDIIRKHGIAEQTFYRWKSKYGGLELSEARRLKLLEEENRRLKQMVADLTLDNDALRSVLEKN